MPLDKVSLKAGIQALHDELYANATNLTPAQAGDRYATALSDLIDTYVKTATLNIPGTGLNAGSVPVTGIAVTGTIE